eukprot:scaffold41434_cov16-Tisochrysis_lutea.AAC.3
MWGLVYDPGKNVLFYSRTNSEDIREYNLASGAESLVTGEVAALHQEHVQAEKPINNWALLC